MLIDLADFALQEQAEDKLMVAISRPWYNGSYTMAAKPFKTLELHYTIIQFLINKVILSFDMIECNSPFKKGQMKMRNGWWHTPTLYKFQAMDDHGRSCLVLKHSFFRGTQCAGSSGTVPAFRRDTRNREKIVTKTLSLLLKLVCNSCELCCYGEHFILVWKIYFIWGKISRNCSDVEITNVCTVRSLP